jgi:hypothetical protein
MPHNKLLVRIAISRRHVYNVVRVGRRIAMPCSVRDTKGADASRSHQPRVTCSCRASFRTDSRGLAEEKKRRREERFQSPKEARAMINQLLIHITSRVIINVANNGLLILIINK